MHQLLLKCPLFAGIDYEQLNSLLHCLNAKSKRYPKDAFVFHMDEPALHVGIVLTGSIHIIQEYFWGDRMILAHVGPGGLFGEAPSCSGTKRHPVSVVTTEASEIMLIDYRKIVTICSSACVFHHQLIVNMLGILADKNISLTRKMEHISQRTTRKKLMSFLSEQAEGAKSGQITIPFDRQELADFLCVERSALSRELARMKEEGLIDYNKNKFMLK